MPGFPKKGIRAAVAATRIEDEVLRGKTRTSTSSEPEGGRVPKKLVE